jgi:hypothetical protein
VNILDRKLCALPTAKSPEPTEAKPRLSLNIRALDDSSVQRYSSRQKKAWFKFPIHNVILALCYATASVVDGSVNQVYPDWKRGIAIVAESAGRRPHPYHRT